MQETEVIVEFTDGSAPLNSSLLVHNPSFNEGVIGNTAWPIHKGRSKYQFVEGYEYYVRASVWCDAGDKIDMRESRPVEKVKVEKGKSLPSEMKFVVAGPCPLWRPK
jgi:hypothetical protein